MCLNSHSRNDIENQAKPSINPILAYLIVSTYAGVCTGVSLLKCFILPVSTKPK